MGMRASAVYIDKTGTGFLTTLQWSTKIDKTLGYELSLVGENEDANVRMTQIFAPLAAFEHLSAIDTFDPEEDEMLAGDIMVTPSLVFSGPQPAGDAVFANVDKDMSLITNWHLDSGSLGVIYDARYTSVLTFFYLDDQTDNVRTLNMTFDELIKVYVDKNAPARKIKNLAR